MTENYPLIISGGITFTLFCLWLTEQCELWGETKEEKRRAAVDYEIANYAARQNQIELRRCER